MTLNTNFAGAALMPPRGKLQGPDRGLDALIGLVIVIVELLIGFLAISALYVSGETYLESAPSARENISAGFAIALFGSAIVVGITSLIFLVRLATGRRSWRSPLIGLILMTVILFVGYVVMAA